MARYTKTFTATYGRDKGKMFLITEVPVDESEDWSYRIMFAMAQSGFEVPDVSGGMAAIAGNIISAVLHTNFEKDAKPLLKEMLGCVKIIPDAKNPSFTRELFKDDIEELPTIYNLRGHIFDLHTLFLKTESQ
jgi:hypothetical protein